MYHASVQPTTLPPDEVSREGSERVDATRRGEARGRLWSGTREVHAEGKALFQPQQLLQLAVLVRLLDLILALQAAHSRARAEGEWGWAMAVQ